MFVVYFFENRNLLLSQLRNTTPSEGEAITIKGRKGKIESVTALNDGKVHVQVILDAVLKGKNTADLAKKKKR